MASVNTITTGDFDTSTNAGTECDTDFKPSDFIKTLTSKLLPITDSINIMPDADGVVAEDGEKVTVSQITVTEVDKTLNLAITFERDKKTVVGYIPFSKTK